MCNMCLRGRDVCVHKGEEEIGKGMGGISYQTNGLCQGESMKIHPPQVLVSYLLCIFKYLYLIYCAYLFVLHEFEVQQIFF